MAISEIPFDDLTLQHIRDLVDGGVPEGRRLEFKRDHYGRTDDAKKEFAADVSALANSSGGDLIIGVSEERGLASGLPGVEVKNSDALILAISESLRSSVEPHIFGLRVRWLEIGPEHGVIIIRVPRSWAAPHRVTVAKDSRFFIRDENGKHAMSVDELRRAFLYATDIENRIREFRGQRLNALVANEGPLALDNDTPCLVVHIIPLAGFSEGLQIEFDDNRAGVPPIGAGGWNSMYSIDGLVSYSGPEESAGSVRAFTTFFRNGVVEAVARLHTAEASGTRAIHLEPIEEEVVSIVARAFRELDFYRVPAPFYILVSILGAKGITAPKDHWRQPVAYPYRSEKILLPDLRIENALPEQLDTLMRPLFDLLWNAFGHRRSPSYDEAGIRRRRR
ncbi:hypothetical protein CO671_23105 [Rhizobium sp. M10]|uniref:AlbA family DNA-binding domain-containing protein n=1 Tax=Rhizobium sp. M10 TaxID=1324586 RepID=UPI000BEAE828|nr:ATP-binding protein [Rhizobium sp. M10]PDT33908.1 hypothetical protein CO671_23105 [Rhizobium sp. M10]